MVNTYKPTLTNLQQGILRLLFVKAGVEMNGLGVAKALEVSQPAVSKALPGLIDNRLITAEKARESGRLSIKLNSENPRVVQLKRADNLKRIYESGFAGFLEKEFAGAAIVLFGSYSRGEDNVRSDIDIAVVGRKEKNIDAKKFENLLGRKINIQNYGSFGEIHKNLRENIFNGIVLYGSVEL